MLILSQHKIVILNFNTATTIIAEKNEVIARLINGNKATLGKYDTEERAKEVLQEIIEEYKSQQYIIFNAENGEYKQIEHKIVYEMPEK